MLSESVFELAMISNEYRDRHFLSQIKLQIEKMLTCECRFKVLSRQMLVFDVAMRGVEEVM
jgi:hypothetical protein